jgi:O-antigen/teichoic acid export membrane protein
MIAPRCIRAIMGNRNYRLASLERSTAAFGRLGLIIGFALVGVLTATTAVWANIAPNLAAMALLFVIIRRVKSTSSGGPSGRVLFKKMGAYALKGWGGVSANLVNWRLDQAFLPALTHATQLGYYAIAVSLAEIPSMMIGATKNVVFSEASHRKDPRIAARSTRTVILISIIIDLAVAILAKPIIVILFGHSFLPAVSMARILLLGNVPWIAEVVLAAGLLSSGRPGLRSSGQIVSAAITVVGLILLVPVLGAIGAAWVSLAAYTINFIITLVMFHHVTKIRYVDSVIPRKADAVWVWNFSLDLVRKGGKLVTGRRKGVRS